MRIYSEVPYWIDRAEQVRCLASFNYQLIPIKYRLGRSPFESITLYKGAMVGLQTTGIPSHALEKDKMENITKLKNIVESGMESDIENIIDRHTSADAFSGLISASFNPKLAQVFAPFHKIEGKAFTIYELKVPANRCLMDTSNTGNSGESKEVMILGYIFPEEIIRFKINNGELESELIEKDGFGGLVLKSSPGFTARNRKVKDPNNWQQIH